MADTLDYGLKDSMNLFRIAPSASMELTKAVDSSQRTNFAPKIVKHKLLWSSSKRFYPYIWYRKHLFILETPAK